MTRTKIRAMERRIDDAAPGDERRLFFIPDLGETDEKARAEAAGKLAEAYEWEAASSGRIAEIRPIRYVAINTTEEDDRAWEERSNALCLEVKAKQKEKGK
jgi:hypothetical protein